MTFSSNPPEDATPAGEPEDTALLKAVLPPLLKDFQHWFGRTIQLLETQEIAFLSPVEQTSLLERVREAKNQVSASQSIAAITDGQAGIEMPVVMAWHKLVYECWGVALRYRKENITASDDDIQDDIALDGLAQDSTIQDSTDTEPATESTLPENLKKPPN
ncbi:MAG: DUF2605 domain-containing protein [Cyanobacteria bacterium J06621_11]